ncbi:hypothetical protein LMIY3S_05148 [Labrys miyagiensis]
MQNSEVMSGAPAGFPRVVSGRMAAGLATPLEGIIATRLRSYNGGYADSCDSAIKVV